MWESIIGFFLLPIVYWLFCILVTGVYFYAIEHDEFNSFAVFITLLGVILYNGVIINLFTNWQVMLIGLIIYLIIGGVWSTIKWWKYCRKWIKNNPPKMRPSYMETVEEWYLKELAISKHKSKIFFWILLWPWSLVWLTIREGVYFVMNSFRGIYNKITKYLVRKALG